MALIRGKDSKPELSLRSLVHRMGYRYRLHAKDLPGKPDMVFPSRNSVIFMHGCFWHRHTNCRLARLPKSNTDFWLEKLEKNRIRDLDNIQKLKSMGWRVLVIWECEMKSLDDVAKKVKKFLEYK